MGMGTGCECRKKRGEIEINGKRRVLMIYTGKHFLAY